MKLGFYFVNADGEQVDMEYMPLTPDEMPKKLYYELTRDSGRSTIPHGPEDCAAGAWVFEVRNNALYGEGLYITIEQIKWQSVVRDLIGKHFDGRGRPTLAESKGFDFDDKTVYLQITLPASLRDHAKAQGNASEYIRSLIEADRKANQ